MGIPRAALCSYRRKAGIRFAIALARSVSAQPDPAVAMGYKLAHEGLSPVVHGAVDLAIRHRHPRLVTDFFRTPVEAEAGRVDRLFAAIARLGDDDHGGVVFGVNLGERGMAALLDEALGVFAHWQRT